MTIINNPKITFEQDERDVFLNAYQWLLDMDETDFDVLNADIKNEYPRCDLNRLFEMLDDLTTYMDNRPE